MSKLKSIEVILLFTDSESFEIRFSYIKKKALEHHLKKHPTKDQEQQLYTLATEKGKYILGYKSTILGVITIEKEKQQPILFFDPITI